LPQRGRRDQGGLALQESRVGMKFATRTANSEAALTASSIASSAIFQAPFDTVSAAKTPRAATEPAPSASVWQQPTGRA